MLTLFLLIALTNFKIILSVENNDTKFINSLPEKQKKEFLLKVEKRIQNEVPEVKSPELNDTNVEAYEKRLEDQGKSIQKILRSEIDSLKSSIRRNTNYTNKEETSHIDLTLRTENERSLPRRRKNVGGTGKDGENIPVVVEYDNQFLNKYAKLVDHPSSELQNKTEKVEKPESKVGEMTSSSNKSLATKPVNINASAERIRAGRRSNKFDATVEESDNIAVGKLDNNSYSNLENNTTTEIDSANKTESDLGITTVQYSNDNDSMTQNFTFDVPDNHTKATNNALIDITTDINSNKTTTTTTKNMIARAGDQIDTDITQMDEELASTEIYKHDSKTHDPSSIIDNDNATIDDLNITKTIDVSINERPLGNRLPITSNNIVSSTETSNDNTEREYETTTADPNDSDSDSVNKENIEKQPRYIPVHNYDPENAYYNANSQPNGNPNGENMPNIITLKETHTKTTNYDLFTKENKKSLRIKDIKERIMSNDNSKQNVDIYDIITSDGSDESTSDDVIVEKPLKHTLSKIRAKLYKNKNAQIEDAKEAKPEDDDNTTDIDSYDIHVHNISELIKKFGVTLQNLVKEANEESSHESKNQSHKDLNYLVKDILNDIANYLGYHKGQSKKDTMENQKKVKKINLKKSKGHSNKEHQSRFHIKDRNENYKQKNDIIYTSIDDDIMEPRPVENQDEIEKSSTEISDEYLKIHVNILKDLVNRNDRGLEKYDWLGTTVFVRAGLAKLQDITENKIIHKKLHHLDQQLLDITIQLYETAKELNAERDLESSSSRRKQRVTFHIPRAKNGKKFNMLNRMYTELKNTRTASRHRRSRERLEDFKEFLDCLELCLDNLHLAIKQVSSITTYKKQRWFKNIHQLFLKSGKEKEYLELLLHLVTARLVRLMDEAAKKMESREDDLMKDRVAVDRIEVEFMLVIKICNQLLGLRE